MSSSSSSPPSAAAPSGCPANEAAARAQAEQLRSGAEAKAGAEVAVAREYVNILSKWHELMSSEELLEPQELQEVELAAARRFADAQPGRPQWLTTDDAALLLAWAGYLACVGVALAWALAAYAPTVLTMTTGRRVGLVAAALLAAVALGVAVVRTGTGLPLEADRAGTALK